MNIHSIIRLIKWRFGKLFYNQEQRLWQKTLFTNEDFKNGKLVPLKEYRKDLPISTYNRKRVVYICDKKISNCGLADRLKGIISIYEICCELNYDFKILFNFPFTLTDFLIPNSHNWYITYKDLNYNPENTDICYIYSIAGTKNEALRQKAWFMKEFKKNYNEFHIRTNARIFDDNKFPILFKRLFKLSERLHTSVDTQLRILGTNYISTSFRFMNLLNDFNETDIQECCLSELQKKELIEQNISQLERLHRKHPNMIILVNSDSITFLSEAKRLKYVYIIPGNITHIDGKNETDAYENYEKTFLDFFMIANAQKIYLLRTGKMYKSGYPGIASLINNVPYEIIEF